VHVDYDTNNSLVTTRLFFLFFFERTRFSFSLVLLHISTWCEVMGNIIKDSQWDPLVAHEISIWTPSIIVYASTLWRFLQPPWVLIGPWVIVRNGIFFVLMLSLHVSPCTSPSPPRPTFDQRHDVLFFKKVGISIL
jgi:hypothetical protein